MRAFFLLLLCGFYAPAIASDLKWDQTTLEFKAEMGQKRVEAAFQFVNDSDSPVEIRNIQTSCGCTTAELPQKVYQAGERGTLKSIFTIGSRRGQQKKTIIVRSGSETTPPDVLTLRVNIPETFKIDKGSLVWKINAPIEPQAFEVYVNKGEATLNSVKAIGGDFEATLEPLDDEKGYRITVTLTSTEKPLKGKIAVEIADPQKRIVYFPVEVLE